MEDMNVVGCTALGILLIMYNPIIFACWMPCVLEHCEKKGHEVPASIVIFGVFVACLIIVSFYIIK
jgi:quinol-cytochrome oxidoreductase complex cytochrome b subunit